MSEKHSSVVSIRGYQAEDHDQVQRVCIETGHTEETPPPQVREMLLTAFCNYYIEQEPENCFVAVDDETVIGYILCTEHSLVWSKAFPKQYVPDWEKNPARGLYEGIMAAPLRYAKEYPAHLHIDLLPGYQRQGIGSRLMDTLIAHLQKKGVPGLMLSVAADNEKGRRFYEKYGFQILETTPHEIVMGMLL